MATRTRSSFARVLLVQLVVSMVLTGVSLPVAETAQAQTPAPCAAFTLSGSEAGQSRTIPCDGTLSNYSKDDDLVTVVQRGTKKAMVAACDDDAASELMGVVNTPICRHPLDNGGVVCDFDTNAVLATGKTQHHCPNLDSALVNVKQGDIVTFYRRDDRSDAEGSVTFRPSASQPQSCTDPWADFVVSTTQGTGTVALNRSNPSTTLGSNTQTVAGSERFYSLGFGGNIILGFNNFIVNGTGNDLTIYESTFGSNWPVESAQISASQDGVIWTVLGTADNKPFQSNYDNTTALDLGSLPWAKYIRFVDTTAETGDNDGFDVNAVRATTAACSEPTSIGISKTGPAQIVRGSVATYQVTVTNNGTSTAQNVVVNDTIPAGISGITYVPSQSDSRCALNAGKVVCSLGSMAAGQSITLNISFQIPNFVPNSGGNQTRTFGGPEYVVREAVNAVPGHTMIPNGANNAGALHYDNATATASCGFLMGAGAVATAYTIGHYDSCGDNTMATWNGTDYTIQGACGRNDFIYSLTCRSAPAPTTCSSTNISNIATVTATGMASRSSNSVPTAISCPPPAEVSISKSGPAQVTRGSTATYQLTVSNTSATAAQNIVVTDNIPGGIPGITYVPSQSDSRCSLQSNRVICNLGTIAGNQSTTVNITFQIPAFVAGTTGGQTVTYGPNEYDVRNYINAVPGHTHIPDTYENAGALHYDATTANASCALLQGPGAVATNYTLGHYVSCGDNNIATWNGSDYTIQNACGRNDFIKSLTCRSATVSQQTCSTATIANIATLTGNGITARSSNAVGTQVNCPPSPDLSISKTGPAQIVRGSVATYQVTVTNNGSVAAPNAVISDNIPGGISGVTYNASQSDSRCALSAGKVVCTLGTIAVGQQVTLNIAFNIPAFVTGGTTGGQTVTYGPQEYDVRNYINAVPGHTHIPDSYENAGAVHYDSVTANASCVLLQGPGAVATAYTLGHYTSCGDNNIATWNGNDYVIQNACGRNDFIETLTCRSAVVTQPTTCTTGNIANIATIVATGMTARTSNAVGTQVNCAPSPTLTVQKSGPANATRGSIAVYQLTVHNPGSVAAPNTVVTDTILTGIPGISMVAGQSDSRCSFVNNKATCNLGTVAAGQTITLAIALQIPAFTAGGGQTQTFSPDYDIRDFVNAVPGHTEIPGHGSSSPASLHYDTATANAACAFLMGPGATATSYTQGAFTTCSDNSLASWNGNDFVTQNSCADNRRINSLTCRAAVQQTCTPSSINDVALITATGMTVRRSNAINTLVGCPVVPPNLSIEKTGPSTIINGSTATYVITVRNTGNGAAQNVEVVDNLPQFNGGSSFVSAVASQGTCLISGSGVTCSLGTLAPNSEETIILVMSVGNAASAQACTTTQTITNTASVSATNVTAITSTPVTSSVLCPNAQCKVRARVNFGYTKNTGNGNMGRTVYLGNNSTAADGQFFDLIVNGQNIVDSIQPTNVPGVGLKRNANNTFSLVFYGFQNANSTEQVYGSVELENAVATSFANDTTWPLEQQGNGQFGFPGNNPQGPTYHDDEVFYQNGSSVVPFAIAENVSADKFTLGFTSNLDPNCLPSDLSITKSGPQTIVAGNKVIYQITVSNSGPAIAQNVIVRDVVPANLTFSPVGSDISCVLNNQTNTVECNLGSVAPGNRTVNIAFDTPTPQQCSTNTLNVVNTATVTSTSQDPNTANNASNVVQTNVTCPQGNLNITKTANQSQITRGDTVSYTITVSNSGQGTVQNVVVTDPVPFISNGTVSFVPSSSDSRCALQGSNVVCNLGALTGNNSVSFTLTFATSQTFTSCTGGPTNLYNTATVTGANSNLAQVTAAPVAVSCPAQSNLAITKSASPANVTRGGTISYAITVVNNGNGPAQNVTITDQLPTLPNGQIGVNSVFTSQGTCTLGNTVTCAIGTLNPGQQVTVNIYVTVGSVNDQCSGSTNLTNIASVVATGINAITSTPVSTTINCGGAPSLNIQKTASTQNVVRGGQMTYTLTVTNSGNQAAQNVTVTDNLPNLNNGSIVVGNIQQTQGTCSVAGGTVSCALGTVNPNSTVTITIPVTVGSVNDTCSTSSNITNSATLYATGQNSQTSNSVSTSVTCPGSPNLNITKSASSNSVVRGGQVTYTITVTNNGSASAQNVNVSDTIAALSTGPVTIGTPSPSQGQCFIALPSGGLSGAISCDLGTINAGSSATIHFTLTMGSSSGTCSGTESFGNTAQVTSSNAATKTVTATNVSVNCPAQPSLSISKSVSPSSITRGGAVAYTITVTNNGQGTAQNVQVVDNVPSPTNGTTVVTSATASNGGTCNTNGTTVTCDLGSMSAGAQRTIVIYATVGLSSNTCSATETLNNTATVTATGLTAVTSNSVGVSVACGGSPNLSITKTASATSVTRGEQLTYTIVVSNTGTQAAQNVTVTDNLPNLNAGSLTVNSTHSTIGTCSSNDPVNCNIGTLNAGQSATITIVVTVGSATTSCSNSTSIMNTATVSSSNAGSQTSTGVQTNVNCPGTANLAITKTASASSVTRGDTLTYTITVQNTGSAAAQNVSVTDNLPNLANGTLALGNITTSQGSCTTSGDTITCQLGTLNASSTVTITIPVTVGLVTNFCSSSTTLSNVATVLATGMSSKTSQSATTTVNCPGTANLTIQKTASTSQVTRGGTLTYTIVVNNGGNAAAQNVVVTDNLPNLSNGSLTVQSANSTIGGACQINGTSISCPVGTLNQNQQATITIVVTVGAIGNTCTSSTSITNTASLTATNMNSQTSNNVTTTVNCPDVGTGEVTIAKTDNRSTVAQGEVLNYVLTLTNTSSQSQTVTVTDSFSTLTTFLSASDNGTVNGNVVTWNNIVVPANGTKTISMNAQVNGSAANGVQIVNQAYTGNKSATDTTTIQGSTGNGLTLVIEDTPDPVEPCEQIRYTLRITNNNSTSTTTDLVLTFQNNDLDFSSATDGGFESGNGVRWNNLSIGANSSRTVQATANVDCDADDNETLRVTGTASSATAEATTRVDEDGSGNNDDIEIDLTSDEDEVEPGDELEYTIELTNDGDNERCGDLELELDSDTSFLDATSNADDESSRRIVWEDVCVDDDDEESFRATVRVRSSAEDGDELEATATWLSEEDDLTVDVVEDGGGTIDENGDVMISKSADRFEANPNDEVTYTITLRNDTDEDLRNVRVTDSFQSNLLQILDPAGGSSSAGRLEWTVSVNSGQVRTIVYRARISGFARPGDIVHNSVIAQGGNMDGSKSASSDVRILGRLPQTGAGDYTKDLEDTSRFLSPFRGGADGGSGFGGLLAFILSSIGLAGAGILGKRFF